MNKLYNLTNPQKSIWLTEQFYKGSCVNNLCGTVMIHQVVDFDLLKKAINMFLRDNDSLRFRIVIDDNGIAKQYISEYAEMDFIVHNIANDTELKDLEDKIVKTPFEIIDSPLFDIQLYKYPNSFGGIITKAHHLVCDACTASLIANKIINIYSGLLSGTDSEELPTSYLTYMDSENEYLSSKKFENDKKYWEEQFTTAPEIATIPSKNSTTTNSCDALRMSFALDEEMVNHINSYCKANGISLFNFLMSLFAVYIGKISDLTDFTLGTPILNRSNFIEKNTPGMFISTVPMKFSLSYSETFVNLAKKAGMDAFQIFRHQRYPYQNILEHIRTKNPSQPNLYDILISYQNTKTNRNTSTIPYSVQWVFPGQTADSLDINIYDMNDTGKLNISYDFKSSKYTLDEIELIHNRIMSMIDYVLTHQQCTIGDIDVVTPLEKEFILDCFNNTDYQYDESLTLIDLFEKQAEKSPNDTAIIYNNKSYTYAELLNMTNQIATFIHSKGIYNKKIAVLMNKSAKTVATFLAIMKSGNAYIPIDPAYPSDRITYIIENSGSNLTICDSSNGLEVPNCVELPELYPQKNTEFANQALPNSLAYIIYTSGSTGKPKGVQIKHKNIINTLLWRRDYYKFDSDITVFQVPSFSFDSSVEDIFTALISGAKLVIPSFTKMDINSICDYISKYNVNHFLVVPSLYRVLLEEKSDYLKYFKIITIAGESFNTKLVEDHFKKLPDVRLVNEYGPTENSVCSTFYEFTADDTIVSIGFPIYNCKCFVVNQHLDLLPPNTPGELCLTGRGLSDEYLNNPKATSEHFVHSSKLDCRLYKTGDIAEYSADCGLVFLGRNDSQVKLHGFRIELSEINNLILTYPEVRDSITLAKSLNSSKQVLMSYILVSKDFSMDLLTGKLKSALPYYMVPEIVILDSYPVTPNGKVDTKALPLVKTSDTKEHKLPSNEIEKTMLDVCMQVLNVSSLHVDDNLFTVGLADSLNILTITSKLFAQNINIPAQNFYEFLTIEKIANNYSKNTLQNSSNIVTLKYKTDTNIQDHTNAEFGYSNVLLTGASGFTGIHLLECILRMSSANITCIVRKKDDISSLNRLRNLFIYYFGKEQLPVFDKRVTVFSGDLAYNKFALNNADYTSLKKCDCVIHAAALTKHYGKPDLFYSSNVIATQNLIDFCKENNLTLNYLSTTSISGEGLPSESTKNDFTENDFYIGQNYTSNVYIKTKFEAEERIFKEQYNGLNANIFRLGNLMGRATDGMFQKNKYDNAFYMRLVALAKVGIIPDTFKALNWDFTPIDDVSLAIIKLLSIPCIKNCVFHITNPNLISTSKLLDVFKKLNLELNFIDFDSFMKSLSTRPSLMKYFVSELSAPMFLDNKKIPIKVQSSITNSYLDKTDFKWSNIDEHYILQFLEKAGFLNDVNKEL